MHEPFDITTVIFAILAVFVVWKLRSVLGQRTGQERPPFDPFAERRKAREGTVTPPAEPGNVIRLPGAADGPVAEARRPGPDSPEQWAGFVDSESNAAEGLRRIGAADPSFSASGFIAGARAAYEMILLAYASGDRATLEPLLAKDVFDSFAASVTDRETRGRKMDTTFVSMEKAMIEDAQLRGKCAQISVRFQPKLITVTHDRDGAVVDGSPDQVTDVTDLWTFSRDTESRDPNWKLVATETVA